MWATLKDHLHKIISDTIAGVGIFGGVFASVMNALQSFNIEKAQNWASFVASICTGVYFVVTTYIAWKKKDGAVK